jgi:tripartite-type tricarboxylate transporter receptor subunit TctC
MKRLLYLLALLVALHPLALQARERIEVLVPGPAGGGPDLIARFMVATLNGEGYQAIVKNIPGAAGELGVRSLLRGSPNTITLMLTQSPVVVINPHVTDRPEKKLWQHAHPMMQVGKSLSNTLLVSDPRYTTVSELISKKKSEGSVLKYGSNGIGSFPHLLLEAVFAQHEPLERLHVPYRGATEALQGLLAGDIDIAVSGTAAQPLVANGRLYPLALVGDRLSPLHPNVPLLSRDYKGLTVVPRFVLFANVKTTPEQLQNIRHVIMRDFNTPAMRERLAIAGIESDFIVDAQLLTQLEREYEFFRTTVNRLKINRME